MSEPKQRRRPRKPDGLHRDQKISLRLAPEQVELVDLYAMTAGTSRADVFVSLLEYLPQNGEALDQHRQPA